MILNFLLDGFDDLFLQLTNMINSYDSSPTSSSLPTAPVARGARRVAPEAGDVASGGGRRLAPTRGARSE